MNNSITLPNGEEFTKYYGGKLIKEGDIALFSRDIRTKYVAPFSTIREYRGVEYKTVEGLDFVSVGDKSGVELLTLCGNYKISGPYSSKKGPQYNVYRCVVWRAGLKSTFGNYADCKQHSNTLLQAVSQLKPLLEG